MHRRWLIFFILIFCSIFFAIKFHRIFLPYIGNYLVIEDNLEKSDAIFVLGGSIPNRIIEAVDIYKQGYAPLIIISKHPMPEGSEFLEKRGISFPEGHDINKSIALSLGISANSIMITEYRTESTLDELKYLKNLCFEKNYKKIILVSTKSHTRRISKIFSDITGDKIKGIVRYTKYDSYNPKEWWKDRTSLRQTLFEYQKMLHHLIVDKENI